MNTEQTSKNTFTYMSSFLVKPECWSVLKYVQRYSKFCKSLPPNIKDCLYLFVGRLVFFFYCQCVYTSILVRDIIEMWKLPVILVISKRMSDSTYQTFCIIYTYVNCILVSVNLFLSKVIRKFARNRYTESWHTHIKHNLKSSQQGM